jgi:hypothetical protein
MSQFAAFALSFGGSRPDGGHRSLALPLHDIAALLKIVMPALMTARSLLRALFGAEDDGLSGFRVHRVS